MMKLDSKDPSYLTRSMKALEDLVVWSSKNCLMLFYRCREAPRTVKLPPLYGGEAAPR